MFGLLLLHCVVIVCAPSNSFMIFLLLESIVCLYWLTYVAPCNQTNRRVLATDEWLRVEGCDGVYALGDCATIQQRKVMVCASCIFSLKSCLTLLGACILWNTIYFSYGSVSAAYEINSYIFLYDFFSNYKTFWEVLLSRKFAWTGKRLYVCHLTW